MFYRKDAVFMAVAGLLASSGFAMAEAEIRFDGIWRRD